MATVILLVMLCRYINARKENLSRRCWVVVVNVITHDEVFEGIVLLNKIKGFYVALKPTKQLDVKIGAGEVQTRLLRSLLGLTSGIEAMSGIPG